MCERVPNNVKKLDAPFDIYKFDCQSMIPINEAFKLREVLLTMPFKKRTCDLYSFSQSSDFYRISNKNKPIEVQQLLEVLVQIKQKISTYLGQKFNNSISVSCSKYDIGDYLLCHDDRVDDRRVAFIYYLNYDWLSEWGGSLDIYSVDKHYNANSILQNIVPEFNAFLFFPVGNFTYHQVSENISKFPRITINGWFHCDNFAWSKHIQNKELTMSLKHIFLPIKVPKKDTHFTKRSIEKTYFERNFRKYIKEGFNTDGYGVCGQFFNSVALDGLSSALFSNNLKWEIKGPLNKMHYKVLNMNNLPEVIFNLVNMLRTEHMIQFFKDCTGLDFIGVNVEVQRWHGGHYMVSGGNDGYKNMHVFRVYIFFSHCIGTMNTDGEDDLYYVFEEHNAFYPKFKCTPQNNTMLLVNRFSNMEVYTKYCRKIDGHSWTVVVANYMIKDMFNCKIKLEKMHKL
ncbi:Hypothetical protein CINCED_3A023091 [Cinara cedri]|uniref:Fe2OG dioxygenase domain-containing protein n=1 Tax=Cinara cedri TaxID=506608 RepID=A0A5E4NSR2_9HEMI|nr:Hypothetical protein CINCED_3A023091 [Cinara cedri]